MHVSSLIQMKHSGAKIPKILCFFMVFATIDVKCFFKKIRKTSELFKIVSKVLGRLPLFFSIFLLLDMTSSKMNLNFFRSFLFLNLILFVVLKIKRKRM